MPTRDQEVVRRRGRRAGIIVFAALVTAFTGTCALQIISQVWFTPAPAAGDDCRAGLKDLIVSVRRARAAAGQEVGGERASVTRFRTVLEPEWKSRDAIGAACRGDPAALRALEHIDQFRYAEEHAARYEAVDLAKRRRRIQSLERELFGAGATSRQP